MKRRAAESVQRGRDALRVGDWARARSLLEAAVAFDETPEALDGLGQVHYWRGDYPAAITYRERAYAGFRARGDDPSAAIMACWLAYLHGFVYGNFAASSGWVERARSLIQGAGDCAERGWVAFMSALFADDLEETERRVAEARRIAERFGDSDLHFGALSAEGCCLVERGRVREGMVRLDEAVAAATSGEVKDLSTVADIYCKMLFACEMALDVRRAEQWMAVAQAFVRRSDSLPVSGIYCRTYYCGVLTAAGRWAEAERELEAAVRTYEPGYRGLRSGALVRLADLRVRQGRLEEAAQLLAGQEQDPYAARPVARLHLIRRDVELAAAVLHRRLALTGEGIVQAPLLALLVEVEVAAGRLEEARAVCARLDRIAGETRSPLARTLAQFSAGITCRAAGDDDATGLLEASLAGFAAAGLLHEEARARLELAHALAETNPKVAVAEARTALERFEQLAAARDADEAANLLRRLGISARRWPKNLGALTKRETEVLTLLAEGLSNEQIAGRLFISPRTAEHHVSNILAKLGLTNRAEATAYAVRHLPSGSPRSGNR
jgi:DNA-binding NarL/FixJ family response regulator/Tfp pilus assembly protein PilF